MRPAHRTRVLLLVAAAVILLLVALTWPSVKARWTPPALPKEKITIALSSTYPGSGLLYIAMAKGFYAQENLDVTLQPYTTGLDAMKAMLEKRADLGTTGDTPLMFTVMAGYPVAVVATIFTAGGAFGTVARRDQGIETIADLKSKRIGVTRGTDGDFILSTMLARSKISSDEVKLVPLPPEAMLDALTAGKVDAIASWEPWLTRAQKSLGENGVEFRVDSGFLLNFSLAGNPEWVKGHPDKIQHLLRALLRAKTFADENRSEAQAIVIKLEQIDPSTFNTAGTRYRFVVQLSQGFLILLDDMARWAIQNKLTDRTTAPNFLDSIDSSALAAVSPDTITIVH
jgi:NitT/TauT family transport system substrate-binding protein